MEAINSRTGQTVIIGLASSAIVVSAAAIAARLLGNPILFHRSLGVAALAGSAAASFTWRATRPAPESPAASFTGRATRPAPESPSYIGSFDAYLLRRSNSTKVFPNTEELDLSYNPLVDDHNVLEIVARFPNLRKLRLRGCFNLTKAGIERLPAELQVFNPEETFDAGRLTWRQLIERHDQIGDSPRERRLCADRLQMRLGAENLAEIHAFAERNNHRALRLCCQTYAFLHAPGSLGRPLILGEAAHSDIKLTGLDRPLQRRELAALFPYFRDLFDPDDPRGAYIQDEIELSDGEAIQTVAEQWGLSAVETVAHVQSFPDAIDSLIDDAKGVDRPSNPQLLFNKLCLAGVFRRPDLEKRYAREYGQLIAAQLSRQAAMERALASGQSAMIEAVRRHARSGG